MNINFKEPFHYQILTFYNELKNSLLINERGCQNEGAILDTRVKTINKLKIRSLIIGKSEYTQIEQLINSSQPIIKKLQINDISLRNVCLSDLFSLTCNTLQTFEIRNIDFSYPWSVKFILKILENNLLSLTQVMLEGSQYLQQNVFEEIVRLTLECPNLTSIYLSDDILFGEPVLQKFYEKFRLRKSEIKEIGFNFNQKISNQGLLVLCSDYINSLQKLCISNVTLSFEILVQIAKITPQLVGLNLSDNVYAGDWVQFFQLTQFKAIQRLILDRCQITDNCLEILIDRLQDTTLTNLSLDYCSKLSREWLIKFFSSLNMTAITHFKVRETNFNDQCLEIVQKRVTPNQIRMLSINFNAGKQISNNALKKFFYSLDIQEPNPFINLQKLYLSRTDIHDDCLVQLQKIIDFRQIQQLSLGQCFSITSQGFFLFFSTVQFEAIESLSLWKTQVCEFSLLFISKFTRGLRWFYFDDCDNIKPEGLIRFFQMSDFTNMERMEPSRHSMSKQALEILELQLNPDKFHSFSFYSLTERVEPEVWSQFFLNAGIYKLKEISLFQTNITNASLVQLAKITKFTVSLNFEYCATLTKEGIYKFFLNSDLQNLNLLYLTQTSISNQCLQVIAQKVNPEKLRNISFAECRELDSEGIIKFFQISKLNNLEEAYLYKTFIQDDLLPYIALSASSLRLVDIEECHLLTEQGINDLFAKSSQFQYLSKVFLYGTRANQNILQTIANKFNPKLVKIFTLPLSMQIDSLCFGQLFSNGPLTGLREIFLNHSQIQDEDLLHLLPCRFLQRIDLRFCEHLTADGFIKFFQGLSIEIQDTDEFFLTQDDEDQRKIARQSWKLNGCNFQNFHLGIPTWESSELYQRIISKILKYPFKEYNFDSIRKEIFLFEILDTILKEKYLSVQESNARYVDSIKFSDLMCHSLIRCNIFEINLMKKYISFSGLKEYSQYDQFEDLLHRFYDLFQIEKLSHCQNIKNRQSVSFEESFKSFDLLLQSLSVSQFEIQEMQITSNIGESLLLNIRNFELENYIENIENLEPVNQNTLLDRCQKLTIQINDFTSNMIILETLKIYIKHPTIFKNMLEQVTIIFNSEQRDQNFDILKIHQAKLLYSLFVNAQCIKKLNFKASIKDAVYHSLENENTTSLEIKQFNDKFPVNRLLQSIKSRNNNQIRARYMINIFKKMKLDKFKKNQYLCHEMIQAILIGGNYIFKNCNENFQ